MFRTEEGDQPEWIAAPIDEKPPGGFPIVFAQSKREKLLGTILLGFVFLFIASLLGSERGVASFPKIIVVTIAATAFIGLLLFGRNRIILRLFADHILLELKRIPYHQVESITVQTTRTGNPIRINIKNPVQTLYLEGLVNMDILARELVGRVKVANKDVIVTIHHGPTWFQLKLLLGAVVVLGLLSPMSIFDAGLWVWTSLEIAVVAGVNIAIIVTTKGLRPKASPRIELFRRVAFSLVFGLPVIAAGALFLWVIWRGGWRFHSM